MMFKTHFAIGVFLILLFLPVVLHKWSFILIMLICTILPDIDMSQSYLGKHKILRPMQWIAKHRGFFHSFTLAVGVALIFAFYYPIFALPFFLGYSGHLIGDALTSEGIRPWWPFKNEIKWRIRTGGKRERMIFYSILIINFILLIGFFV
jgi:membrane-bound metal-dependent hydrolase YbcI (DUF457 family)